MTYKVTYSADLLRNFLQSDIVAPESKFEALQSQDGASLLFSKGTDSALYVMAELPQSRSGWDRTDISSAVVSRDFAGKPGAMMKDFATAQRASATSAGIHLSMVITDGYNDHLYLSMNNPNSGPDWAQTQPAWTSVPFDDPNVTFKQLVIAGIFITEATDAEYLVVDLLRTPGDPQSTIVRYYIDPSSGGKQAWQPHALGIDLSAAGYVSCLGRKWGEDNDGLYTSGHIQSSPQLQYQPLYDDGYGTNPSRFKIPGGLTADTIAATRNADNTSDLYIAAGGGLYYLASKNQKDGASATFLFSDDLFKNVLSLFATAVPGGGAIVWGRNAVNQVFYVTCATSNPATAVWSKPLPIMTAEQISPYLDRDNDANTFFAHTALGKLTKSVRSPDTTMWTSREITLAPQATTTPANNFSSYTTTVRITDESDQPVEAAEVTVLAANNTHAYINYEYFVLASTPATVLTDSDGTVTIIEPADGVAGTRLKIGAGDVSVEINPMDTAFRKASSLNSSTLLIDAQIVSPDGTQTPLVPAGTPSDSLSAAADGNTALAQAYNGQQGVSMLDSAAASRARRAAAAAAPRSPGAGAFAPPVKLPGGLDSILVDAGDMFLSYAEQAVKTVVKVVLDAESGLYAFVAQIGGEVFHCLLDCVESIASGAWHLLMMIVDEIESIIKFLEFLFEWRDISRTKDVVANILKVTLEYQVAQFAAVRPQVDDALDSLQQEIATWANLDWSGLGDTGESTPDSSATGVPQQTSPSALVTHHYQNNAEGSSQLKPDSVTAPDSPLTAVMDALTREGDTLYEAISQVLTLATELPTMPLDQALTTFAGILGETLIESMRNVLDPLLDFATDLGSAMLATFEAPIHIPVVSDILEYFGISELSFLDIAAWLAALPGTILYKIAVQEAPFPDNDETTFLITAPDWPTLLAGVTGQQQLAAAAAPPGSGVAVMAGTSASGADMAIEFLGHFLAGAGSLGQAIVGLEEPLLPAGSRLGKWATFWSIIGGASGGAASWATNKLVPANAVKNPAMVWFGDVLIAVRLYLKYCCAVSSMDPYGAPTNIRGLVIKDDRGLFSFGDALLGLASLGVTICHFTELATTPGESDVLIAVIDEVSNLAAVASRASYPFAVNAPDPDSAAPAIIALTVCNLLTANLQLAVCPLVLLE